MNKRYVIVAAVKGLTEARGNINAKFYSNIDIVRKWLSVFIDDQIQIDAIIKSIETRGYALGESTSEYVNPICFKIMTEDYMERLI